MATIKELNDFYTRVMNCNNTEKDCPAIWKDNTEGIVPRGFYFGSPKIKFLVVIKNPGHPMTRDENRRYIGKKGKELLDSYRKFQREYYFKIMKDENAREFKARSNVFHKNLFRYLGKILDVPKVEIYNHVAHTNLVKCNTKDEHAKIPKETIRKCFDKFFREELQLFKPKVILACGNEVFKFLEKFTDEYGFHLEKLKHPSYYYRKDEEDKILSRIKKNIEKYF